MDGNYSKGGVEAMILKFQSKKSGKFIRCNE